jgi:nucleoside-diphosphate-sugar epimerase
MRVLVLGGTGAMGILMIRRALAEGHLVTIYARNPSKLPEGMLVLYSFTSDTTNISHQQTDISSHESVIINKGELTDEDSLRYSMRNVDAILSNLGPGTTPSHFPGAHPSGKPLAKAYSTILRLMKEPDVACKRIILLGTVSIPDPADKRDFTIWTLVQGVKVTAYDAYADEVAIGELFRTEGTGVEWTIVRVPLLTNIESEETIAGYVGDGKTGAFLSRAGFAAFCVEELERKEWLMKVPVISSK